MNQDDRVFQKLLKWISLLENQATEVHEQRLVFERVRAIVQKNPKINGNVFFEHLNIWYSSSIAIAIRRLVDKNVQSISYVSFLKMIENNPRAISRSRIVQAWNGHHLANDAFSEYAGNDKEFLPAGFVDPDLKSLLSRTKVITTFADKLIAHNDSGPTPKIPTFADLTEALNCLEAMHNKYAAFLTGYSVSLTPSIVYPWENIFREAWIV